MVVYVISMSVYVGWGLQDHYVRQEVNITSNLSHHLNRLHRCFTIVLDYCLPSNPCQNGGRCISTTTNYVCDCTGTGYTGMICTDLISTSMLSLVRK
jgi:hypothetical protein